MKVPLDYAAPEGRAIDIKLSKAPAGEERIGTLVVNPGGPGGSGIAYAEARSAAWSLDLMRHYDVVGFDPRGVGQSTPLHCLGTGPTSCWPPTRTRTTLSSAAGTTRCSAGSVMPAWTRTRR